MIDLRLLRIAVAAAVVLACGSGPGPISRPPVAVRVSPSDGMTGLNELAVDVSISPGSLHADDLDAIGRTTRLFTWPTLMPLETVILAAGTPDAGASGFPVANDATIHFTPMAPVADGWYVAILGGLPARASLPSETTHVLGDGRLGVRVHVGSAPALWGVAECPKEGAITAIVIGFTEAVRAATTSTMSLAVTTGPAGAPMVCAGNQIPLADRALQEYEYICPKVGPTDLVTISVTAGLTSQSGVQVPLTERAVAMNAFSPNGFASGCPSLKIDP